MIAFSLQLLLMPFVMRTYDHGKAYTACMCMFPCIFMLLPLMNPIARGGVDEVTGLLDTNTTAIIWALICLMLGMSRLANMAYSYVSLPHRIAHFPNLPQQLEHGDS